jgi:hypothetical protein
LSNFRIGPNAARNIERVAFDSFHRQRRDAVQRVECPDHHRHPDLVRDHLGLHIAACCRKAAELATTTAGLGQVSWRV